MVIKFELYSSWHIQKKKVCILVKFLTRDMIYLDFIVAEKQKHTCHVNLKALTKTEEVLIRTSQSRPRLIFEEVE